MRLSSTLAVLVVGVVSLFPAAYAWGADGHEIVATIAQMYLHPTVLATLCDILDDTQCHLAPISTWADKDKFLMKWSAPLHYVGSVDDYPPNKCAYPGTKGWNGLKEINVLDGIKNVTGLLEDWVNHDASDNTANEALKFLVHFLGDMHQPLHLTGRDRGGNLIKVTWNKRETDLHSLWDDLLITRAVQTVPKNYSRPLSHPEIEGALRGADYDPYIRRIVWEGILSKWADEVDDWLSCPTTPTPQTSVVETEITSQEVLTRFGTSNPQAEGPGVEINPDRDGVCPYFWSQPSHALNCDIVWPKKLAPQGNELNLEAALLELDTPEYAGVIQKHMIVEKALAQGGIRLAGLLNYVFADQGTAKAPFIMPIKK